MKLAQILTAGVVAAILGAGAVGTANAGDYGHHDNYGYKVVEVVHYEKVTSYEYREEAYTKYVTEYDSYGCPYQVAKTFYRKIEVPVYKYVPVKKFIKVPYYGY